MVLLQLHRNHLCCLFGDFNIDSRQVYRPLLGFKREEERIEKAIEFKRSKAEYGWKPGHWRIRYPRQLSEYKLIR